MSETRILTESEERRTSMGTITSMDSPRPAYLNTPCSPCSVTTFVDESNHEMDDDLIKETASQESTDTAVVDTPSATVRKADSGRSPIVILVALWLCLFFVGRFATTDLVPPSVEVPGSTELTTTALPADTAGKLRLWAVATNRNRSNEKSQMAAWGGLSIANNTVITVNEKESRRQRWAQFLDEAMMGLE